MKALDRLLTIVVTITLTSAFWIVAGGSLMERSNPFAWSSGRGGEGGARASLPASTRSPAAQVPAERSIAPVAQAGNMLIPVAGVRADQLVDTYTQSRSGGARLHEAIDIMAPRGTPVLAAAPGRVEKLFTSDAGGLTIYVRSADGRTVHYYAHLDGYARGLAEGQQVRRGQRLGTVGSTGNAAPDGPHLHFAVMETRPAARWWEPARAINPYPLLVGD